jgi:hypothetical protein
MRLDTFLRAGRFRPASSVAQRYARAISRRFRAHLSNWAHQNGQRFVHCVNAVTSDGFQRLRLNLDDLAVLPRKAFGLAIAEPAGIGEEFGGLSMEPKIEIHIATGWNPSIRRSLSFCPTFMVRSWLRNDLRSKLLTFVTQQQTEALDIISKQLDEDLRALCARITEYAANLGARAIAIPSGRADHLEGEFRGENVPSYCDQLLVIFKNFSLIRDEIQSSRKNPSGASFVITRPIPVQSLTATFTSPRRLGVVSDRATRGCPICDRLVGLSKEFFVKFQYALYNDEREQESFAESRGFCPFHTWQLEAISSPVGFSVGCAKLVKRISALLKQVASTPECANENLARFIPEQRDCRVCALLREAEEAQIKALCASLQGTTTKQSYARSQGVCLRHLEMLVKSSSDCETVRFLLQTASTVFQLISEDMEGFALKREAARRHLVSEDEEDAYLRAIIHFAGAKHNSAPWTYRDEI